MLVAAACTGGDDSGTTAETFAASEAAGGDEVFERSAADAAEPASAPAEEVDAAEDTLGSGGVTPVGVQTAADIGRDIIFTADLTVSVSNVAAAGEQATQIIESLGGFVFGQQTSGSPEPVSILTFRIEPSRFQEALSRLGGIGELRNQNVSADDVTGRVVDLQSRITTAETSVTRLREFLANATVIEDVAKLEAQLLARETDLETLRGQLRTIQDQVALATITLTLTEAGLAPQVQLTTTAYPGADDAGASCPGNSSLSVEEGSEVTLCFEFRNAGDAALTAFEFTDSVLDIDLTDLVVIFGDLKQPLQPGQNMIFAFETPIERTLRTQSRVKAIPLDADGVEIPAREVANTQSITVFAEDPGGLPGFADGLSASWSFLQTLWGLLVLVAGGLLPFIWVIPLAWWLIGRTRGRAGSRRASVESAPAHTPAAATVAPADQWPAADDSTSAGETPGAD